MTEKEKTIKVDMPLSHRIGNVVLTKIFNLRHRSNIKDVTCGLVAFSPKVLNEINWKHAPSSGWGIDAYIKKEALRLSKEKGIKIVQIPVNVNYYEDKPAPLKNKLRKYGNMFFEVLRECIKS